MPDMSTNIALLLLATFLALSLPCECRNNVADVSRMFLQSDNVEDKGTKWAVLVAGSYGYWNYRHQADICHAYQIMKRGGLKDENIIVFMYDDIASNSENPTPGIIINKPNGTDVYKGVPKDYTGNSTTAANLYAVLLANKTGLSGGSGKVLESGPNDRVFFYYADHGAPGLLAMPVGDDVYATDLNRVFKTLHESNKYKSMVVYIEACESGSMVDGLLPSNIGIYATTASNPNESSWGYYCDDSVYNTCLGDLYSIAWMEDSDAHNSASETLERQYKMVRERTNLSHVMQYGNMGMSQQYLATYVGKSEPIPSAVSNMGSMNPASIVNQRDTDLLYYQRKVEKAREGSAEKVAAKRALDEEIAHRAKIDGQMESIAKSMLGERVDAFSIANALRTAGSPVVDDWDCFKSSVRAYKRHCGQLTSYGRQYTRVLANMCNNGANTQKVESIIIQACSA
ncbi:hypothetical protein MLD38_005337 [Melastoma candidum]|uniref:Uncharacterized protein n=1 Tax=Melastoma candidum TaxID=119954 RepID=A0ACB9S8M9_9MYRT|nr:hypothetical protein MLD38_005337 [Melastoma candidum]